MQSHGVSVSQRVSTGRDFIARVLTLTNNARCTQIQDSREVDYSGEAKRGRIGVHSKLCGPRHVISFGSKDLLSRVGQSSAIPRYRSS